MAHLFDDSVSVTESVRGTPSTEADNDAGSSVEKNKAPPKQRTAIKVKAIFCTGPWNPGLPERFANFRQHLKESGVRAEIQYWAFAHEHGQAVEGEHDGYDHGHLMIVFKNTTTIGTQNTPKIQRAISEQRNWNIQKMKGTPEQAKAYLQKGEGSKTDDGSYDDMYGQNVEFWEYGDFPVGQGRNQALQQWVTDISKGIKTADDVLIEDASLYSRYNRALLRAEQLWMRSPLNQDRVPPICKWFMGPPGCGKSRHVHAYCDVAKTYRVQCESLGKSGWWDLYDYNEHENMIVDDVDGNLKFKFALRLCDRYPMTVERRHIGPCPFKCKYIYFTSTRRPEEIWKQTLEDGENFKQFYRRVQLWVWDEEQGTFIHDKQPVLEPITTSEGSYAGTFVQ